jgi:hypothetical protein
MLNSKNWGWKEFLIYRFAWFYLVVVVNLFTTYCTPQQPRQATQTEVNSAIQQQKEASVYE